MTDTKTTLTWVLKDEVSGPARGIGGALGGLVNPMALAAGGALALAGGLALAVKAAVEEEVNIKKLDAALVASIPGWDGNTEAIEALIDERENLAFSDDELRDSLAMLVVATNDVEEAQNLQALAMDLARLKGVDLATATAAVTKASEGSTREIRALGLAVDESATSVEILGAISEATAGQAAGYAETTQGRWEALQIKIGDLVEDVGSQLLPIFETLVDFAINDLIPAIEDFAEVVGPILKAAFKIAGDYIGWWIDNIIKPAIKFIQDSIRLITDIATALGSTGLFVTTPPPKGSITGNRKVTTPRAEGGPVDPYGTYLVGEQGPELLQMGNRGGSVIPGVGSGMVPVEIPVILDGEEIGRIVDHRLYIGLMGAGGSSANR